ncbi:hypothetical protein FQN54_005420 [Arachnomyces sp. PD_36]|nr:hypothetical protein FQN54_005420 [Arachnomyces sp. PD_36]
MHFFKYFCVFFMPILAVAIPAPDAGAVPNPNANAALNLAKVASSLQGRQDTGDTGDLGGLVGDLLDGFGNIGDLLNADTFKEIDIILRNLAAVLDDEGTKKAKNLVSNANDLLTPEFVDQTKGLIADVAPLISSVAQLISAIISSLFGNQG